MWLIGLSPTAASCAVGIGGSAQLYMPCFTSVLFLLNDGEFGVLHENAVSAGDLEIRSSLQTWRAGLYFMLTRPACEALGICERG